MCPEIQEVLRLLMLTTKQNKKHGLQNKGGLLVLIWTETNSDIQELNCIVAGAGLWCAGIKMEELKPAFSEVMTRLKACSGRCAEPDIEDLCAFTDLHGSLNVFLSFRMKDAQQIFRPKWRHQMQTFFKTFSLVNAEINIDLKLRIDQKMFHQEFRTNNYHRVALSAHQILFLDVTSSTHYPEYFKRELHCSGGHPDVGDSFLLSIPPKVMDQGLLGTVSLQPLSLLRPCVLQYPNVETKLTQIIVLVYSPSNVPVTSPLAFLQNLPAHLNCQELGLESDSISFQELNPCGGTIFRVDQLNSNETTEDPSQFSIDQSLLLFLFLQHTDPFTTDVSDIMATEMTLEHHLVDILNNNKHVVTRAVRNELKKTLKAQCKRKKEHDKMRSACEVILSSSISIISSSSNLEFRNACLNNMKVQNTHELSAALSESLLRATFSKYVPKRMCSSDQTVPQPGSYQHFGVEM